MGQDKATPHQMTLTDAVTIVDLLISDCNPCYVDKRRAIAALEVARQVLLNEVKRKGWEHCAR